LFTRVQLNLNTVNQFIGLIRTTDFDQNAALEFGKIQAELRKIGRPTGEIDALIAAVARSQRYILITNNTRHFINISDLRLENWLDV
jgi:tRNA(fMet)-specific endonuclease VapC